MSQGYPSFPSWDPVQPEGYAPPPAVTYSPPPAADYAPPVTQLLPPAPDFPATWSTAESGHGTATVAVTMRYAPIAFLFGLVKPVLTIDGQRVRAGWKRRVVVPVDPGSHLVHVHVPFLIPPRAGEADLPVELAPGQSASLEYRAPLVTFMRGALGAAPQRYPGVAAAVAVNAVAVTALLAGGLLGFTNVGARPGFALPAASTPSAAPEPEAPPFPVAPTGPAVPKFPESSQGAGGAGPAFRDDAPGRKVAGATFQRGDATATAGSRGWPFAFRIPGAWRCVPGKVDLPKADAVVCFDKKTEKNERAGIILRVCPSACDAADRQQLDKDWFVNTSGLRRADAGTRFRQTAKNGAGKYQLELSHFFTDPASGVKYQVGVDARTDPARKATAQKVVNDVLSQTTF
ncbi:hypothetical protein Acy02nite_75980 [Actinoplanes cyaneus]|uniref:Uncharacterized protein n=1 Tax=Actinoplanes cyaneus TaxID=52696 RepID=A0A919IR24_9ACTN|nr:hypothetical protein [Actinoplanes cyaneus]MCW2143649.1 hypothetical protein [Actinoplanes cyaneus]GID69717.1 hypothetical protein Acy02nite_75980 [Actinoplanes cyaneus]